ncbi:MAG: multicopper oxidase domain-containing protein [Nitrospiraceae bacterium]|nr:multicopper oxidase domain-containing protein [Nitrospiraceae bacterium]MBX9841828.1 multicopper oxidase domain-containing protein [Xanthobacteraceae bacterium]
MRVGYTASIARAATFLAALLVAAQSSFAATHDIVIERHVVNVTGRERVGMLINGQLPGPVLRLKEGEDAVINVTNRLDENASIHWHGLIVPPAMDGVPGISPGYGDGIKPGETFTYRFKVRQSGTYWFHSHSSGEQEQLGMYAPLIIEPRDPDPFKYDREYIIMFSDWTDEDPKRIVRNLKQDSSWYNFNRQTLVGLFQELGHAPNAEARQAIINDRITWSLMRMDPTDLSDVSGYTFLVNGQSAERNFTALFHPGERVRLRFINAATTTYFDVRIPGLKMTVVQADGNNVQPVRVDEFRMAIAETYDVIVQPTENRAYAIVGESVDRTGFARATLAPRPGMVGQLPPHRPRRLVSMSEMAMNPGPQGHDRGTLRPEQDMPGHVVPPSPMGMSGMDNMSGGGDGSTMSPSPRPGSDRGKMPGMGGNQSGSAKPAGKKKVPAEPTMPGMKHSGAGAATSDTDAQAALAQGADHSGMAGMNSRPASTAPRRSSAHSAMGEASAEPVAEQGAEDMISVGDRGSHGGMADPIANDTGAPPGAKVLSYRDLRPLKPYPYKPYDRIIELRLTGNMQRYFWSINGRKFSEADPIVLRLGERARFRMINETMMNHPMHIHGTWMLPDVGSGPLNPKKHTVNIKPGTTLDIDIPADAEGPWAFHCHILYHMETGMMRQINVVRQKSAMK